MACQRDPRAGTIQEHATALCIAATRDDPDMNFFISDDRDWTSD